MACLGYYWPGTATPNSRHYRRRESSEIMSSVLHTPHGSMAGPYSFNAFLCRIESCLLQHFDITATCTVGSTHESREEPCSLCVTHHDMDQGKGSFCCSRTSASGGKKENTLCDVDIGLAWKLLATTTATTILFCSLLDTGTAGTALRKCVRMA